MAASYQTGTATSPSNLLQTIATWLSGQGWTVDANAAEGSGWRTHVHKGSVYVHLRAAMDENLWERAGGGVYHDDGAGGYGIGLYLGTGYAGGSDWDKQAGGPQRVDGTNIGAGMNLPSGSISAYHLFDDGNDNVTIVVERSPGIFCHMGFGFMVDQGHNETHWFFHGSSPAFMNTFDEALPGDRAGISITAWPPMSAGDEDPPSDDTSGLGTRVHATSFVRVDAATFSGRWVTDAGYPHPGFGYTGRFLRDALVKSDPSDANGRDDVPGYQFLLDRIHQTAFASALTMPLFTYVETSAGRYAPAGYPPTVFWSEAVDNGLVGAGDVKAVAGDDFMFFPGFAVRKAA